MKTVKCTTYNSNGHTYNSIYCFQLLLFSSSFLSIREYLTAFLNKGQKKATFLWCQFPCYLVIGGQYLTEYTNDQELYVLKDNTNVFKKPDTSIMLFQGVIFWMEETFNNRKQFPGNATSYHVKSWRQRAYGNLQILKSKFKLRASTK